ncbi:conserved hypothetical protein [Neospora caninum Liverpool]|uniref:Uncharacterized protein n=1 Tax=Neospora caninum (strain Liverpool) TaxID=572307 RepID=F0VJ22_NEOCL|nr:conserved hypothetical protein [Neospora caninum Liverpool]CBZ53733.1 conserved hypothetical protein [Neospora caninum Liverpool]CEL67722.1 TPA: hypothetical protein BN1204_035150 [Neospora caninum Liverpool]|eukprot:XP_003883765.1 conserved hypothetical protein [Neospora caninum Liverpool]
MAPGDEKGGAAEDGGVDFDMAKIMAIQLKEMTQSHGPLDPTVKELFSSCQTEQQRLAAVATEAVDRNDMKRYDQISDVLEMLAESISIYEALRASETTTSFAPQRDSHSASHKKEASSRRRKGSKTPGEEARVSVPTAPREKREKSQRRHEERRVGEESRREHRDGKRRESGTGVGSKHKRKPRDGGQEERGETQRPLTQRGEERRRKEVGRDSEKGRDETWAAWPETDVFAVDPFFPGEKDLDWGRAMENPRNAHGEQPTRRESEREPEAWPHSSAPPTSSRDRATRRPTGWCGPPPSTSLWSEEGSAASDTPETPREEEKRRTRDTGRTTEMAMERNLKSEDAGRVWRAPGSDGSLACRDRFRSPRGRESEPGRRRRGSHDSRPRPPSVSSLSASSRSDREDSLAGVFSAPDATSSWAVHLVVHRALFLPIAASGTYAVVASLLSGRDSPPSASESDGVSEGRKAKSKRRLRAAARVAARAVSSARSSNSSGECVWEETLVLPLCLSARSSRAEKLRELRLSAVRLEIADAQSKGRPLATANQPVSLAPLAAEAQWNGSVALHSSRGGNGSLSFSLFLDKRREKSASFGAGAARAEARRQRRDKGRERARATSDEESPFFEAPVGDTGGQADRRDSWGRERDGEQSLGGRAENRAGTPAGAWGEGVSSGLNNGVFGESRPGGYGVPSGNPFTSSVWAQAPAEPHALQSQNERLVQQIQQLQQLLLASQQREHSLQAQLQASQVYTQQVLQVLSAAQAGLKQREGEGEKFRESAQALETAQRELCTVRDELRERVDEVRDEANAKARMKKTLESQNVELEKLRTKLAEQADLLRDARERLAIQRRRCARLRDDLVEADELTELVKGQLSLSQSQEKEQQRQILALAYCLGVASGPERGSDGALGSRDDEAWWLQRKETPPPSSLALPRLLALPDAPHASLGSQQPSRRRVDRERRSRGDPGRSSGSRFLIRECSELTDARSNGVHRGVSRPHKLAAGCLRGEQLPRLETPEGRRGRFSPGAEGGERRTESEGESSRRRSVSGGDSDETDGDREDHLESTTIEDWRLTPTVLISLQRASQRAAHLFASHARNQFPLASPPAFLSLPLQSSPCSLLQHQLLTTLFQQAVLEQKKGTGDDFLLYETDAIQVFWASRFLPPCRSSCSPRPSSLFASSLCAASAALAQLASRAFATHSLPDDSPGAALAAAARAWAKDRADADQRERERRLDLPSDGAVAERDTGFEAGCGVACGCLFALSLRASAGQALQIVELRLEREVFGSQGAFVSLEGGIEQATLLPRASPLTLFGSALVAGPYRQAPIVRLSYLLPDSVRREIRLRLPLPPAAFCFPYRMRPHAFVRAWEALHQSSTSLICDKLKPAFFSPAGRTGLGSPYTSLVHACTLSNSFASLPGLDRRTSRNVVAAGYFPVSARSEQRLASSLLGDNRIGGNPARKSLHAPWDSATDRSSDELADLSDQASDDTALSFSSPSFRPRKASASAFATQAPHAPRWPHAREEAPLSSAFLPCLLRVELLSLSAALSAGVLPALPSASGPTSRIRTSPRAGTPTSLARWTAQPVSSAATACARIEVRCPDEEIRQSVVETLAELLMDEELLVTLSPVASAQGPLSS